jgi:hypothetical protein
MPRKSLREVINNFRSNVLGIRVKPNPRKSTRNTTLGNMLDGFEGSTLIDISEIEKFRAISDDRNSVYRIFDEMSLDSTVSTVLEMYTDDATQYNSKGLVVWVESDDENISRYSNRLLDVLKINSNAWSHVYNMIKYGDVYIELFRDNEIEDKPNPTSNMNNANVDVVDKVIGSKLSEYIEAEPNPATIYDIMSRGKTIGFIKTPESDFVDPVDPTYNTFHRDARKADVTEVLPPDKYIHIALALNTTRFPEKLQLAFRNDNISELDPDYGSITYKEYNINRGRSILHNVYRIYRELKLMEDSLLLNRVTRSSIIRLLQIEVGDMPKSQVREMLKRIKSMIEQKNFMDKTQVRKNIIR